MFKSLSISNKVLWNWIQLLIDSVQFNLHTKTIVRIYTMKFQLTQVAKCLNIWLSVKNIVDLIEIFINGYEDACNCININEKTELEIRLI